MRLSKEDLEELGFTKSSFFRGAYTTLNNSEVTGVTIPTEKFENGMSVKELIDYVVDAMEDECEQQIIWDRMGEEL